VGGSLARCLLRGRRTGAGRCRNAISPAPACWRFPSSRTPGHRTYKSNRAVLPRRAILSPRRLPVKGAPACGLRVPCYARADP